MPKGKKQKPVAVKDSRAGVMLTMDFDEAMRRVVRVQPEKKPAKRKK